MSARHPGEGGEDPPLLVLRTAYSLLRGSALPEALVQTAAEAGYRAVALTDRENLYATIPFLDAARAHGRHAILGAELVLPLDARRARLTLLCREIVGYRNLSEILTRFHLQGEDAAGHALAAAPEGLTVLTADPDALERLRARFDATDLGALLASPEHDARREIALRETARRLGVEVVAVARASRVADDERSTQALLAAIRTHGMLPQVGRAPAGRAPSTARDPWDARLPGAQDARRLFAATPEGRAALRGAQALIERCRLSLEDLTPSHFILPSLHGRRAPSRLRWLCSEGLRRRGLGPSRRARARLEEELRIVETLGFADYFLIVAEIVSWAHGQGIHTVGRGSGASSMIAYILGITSVDPIRYGLCFERFLHPLRRDLPDLDVDIAWDRRDRVLEFALTRFGRERAAMISTHQFFRARGAFREAGRALGLSDAQLEEGARRLPHAFFGAMTRAVAAPVVPGSAGDADEAEALRALAGDRDPSLRRVAAAALPLLGLPRNLGMHPGGIVFGDGPLARIVPLEPSASGPTVTQFEMRAIERIGLVKIDLLGNRALGTVEEAARIAGIDPEQIPEEDPATARLLAEGRALGAFQLESPAMRTLLRQLRPRDLDGVIASVALIRPGPAGSGMKAAFIRRAHGAEAIAFLHPSLAPALQSTLGLPLYEEDIIRMAAALTGMSLGEADLFRRAVTEAARRAKENGNGDALLKLEAGFLEAVRRRGLAPDVARAAWEDLVRFAAYAFCKAHAAGYGLIAHRTAWLKVHYPGPFFAALLNHHRGMYPSRVYVDEARRLRLRALPPSVTAGGRAWRWEPPTEDGPGVLRCGLGAVRGLRAETIAAILRERSQRRFADLADLMRRTAASAPELEALILCGACDDALGRARGELLWQLRTLLRRRATIRRAPVDQGALPFAAGEAQPAADAEAERGALARPVSLRHRAMLERRLLGASLVLHPVALLPEEETRGAVPVTRAMARAGERVRVVGIVSALRRARAGDGRALLFLTIEDESGLLEGTVRPDLLARGVPRVALDAFVQAVGRMRLRQGAPGLEIDALRVLGRH
jgi:DNA-directed DNA polymerase III PolC